MYRKKSAAQGMTLTNFSMHRFVAYFAIQIVRELKTPTVFFSSCLVGPQRLPGKKKKTENRKRHHKSSRSSIYDA